MGDPPVPPPPPKKTLDSAHLYASSWVMNLQNFRYISHRPWVGVSKNLRQRQRNMALKAICLRVFNFYFLSRDIIGLMMSLMNPTSVLEYLYFRAKILLGDCLVANQKLYYVILITSYFHNPGFSIRVCASLLVENPTVPCLQEIMFRTWQDLIENPRDRIWGC